MEWPQWVQDNLADLQDNFADPAGCRWKRMQMDESSIKKSYSNILDKCWTQVLFEADVACCFVDHKSIEIPPKNEEKIFRPPLSFVMMQRYILVQYI